MTWNTAMSRHRDNGEASWDLTTIARFAQKQKHCTHPNCQHLVSSRLFLVNIMTTSCLLKWSARSAAMSGISPAAKRNNSIAAFGTNKQERKFSE